MFNDRNQSLLEHNYRWKCDFCFLSVLALGLFQRQPVVLLVVLILSEGHLQIYFQNQNTLNCYLNYDVCLFFVTCLFLCMCLGMFLCVSGNAGQLTRRPYKGCKDVWGIVASSA